MKVSGLSLCKGIAIGTWSVCMLHKCGQVHELCQELKRYDWDVVGLAEMHWQMELLFNHRLFYIDEMRRRHLGVGFLIHEKIPESVISWSPVEGKRRVGKQKVVAG